MKVKIKTWGKVIIFFIAITLPLILYIKGVGINYPKIFNIKNMTYNEFLKQVEDKKIKNVIYKENSNYIDAYDVADTVFKVPNPKTESFREYLVTHDVVVNYSSNQTIVNPAGVLIGITIIISVMLFMTKKNQQGLDTNTSTNYKINTSNISEINNNISDVKLSDIAGNKFIRNEIEYIIDFLKNPSKFNEVGARMPKGMILYGPPGTGKTLTAKAIAGEAGVPFFSTCGSDFVEMYVGVGAKRIRELFNQARKKAPCIIFIDEIDAVGKKRGVDSNGERDNTINALLSEIDGFSSTEGILIIGATNRLDMLDDALIRPGRFDKHISIPLPDYKDRIEMINMHLKNKNIEDGIELKDIAKLTIGFSGAGIETLLNESSINAVINNRNKINKADLDYAYYKMIMKGDKKDIKEIDKHQLKIVAWHEAGHALVCKLLTKKSIPKVTIVPSTNGAGGVTFIIPENINLLSKEDIINEIKTLYAGRIAEFLLLENDCKITTGASQDIKKASELIFQIIEEFGMNENIGLLYVKDKKHTEIFSEAKKISNDVYEETKLLLEKHIKVLKEIAENLIEKETIEEFELDEIINKRICRTAQEM